MMMSFADLEDSKGTSQKYMTWILNLLGISELSSHIRNVKHDL